MEKRYLLTVTKFDEEKSQITIVDQKQMKVVHQSISELKIIGELIQAFSVMYGNELKIMDKATDSTEHFSPS